MDLFFNYDKSDLESPDAYAYGIVEYHGCGADSHGERFNITDGYVTANGDWQFYKRYVGDGPYKWTHAWRYFGNIIGQVWNGGIQYANANEMEKPLTQAFFYPVEDNSYTCDPYEDPLNPYGGGDDDVTDDTSDDDVTDNDSESGYSDNGDDSDNNDGPTPEHIYPVSGYENDDATTLAPYTTEPADTTTVTTTTTAYSTTTTIETTVSTTFSTIVFTTDGGYAVPTVTPTIIIEPTITFEPTYEPTTAPRSTWRPTEEPTYAPETESTYSPETEPTYSPETEPTNAPETEPTYSPETEPTNPPETDPTYSPETEPTYSPETEPTFSPETEPTYSPETEPTNPPETEPTYSPETEPTNPPETEPTYSPETEPTAPPPEPTNPYNGGDEGSNDGYGFMTDGDDSNNNGGYDYGFFDDDDSSDDNSDFDAPHKTNSELVNTCATRLSQLKGIYGSEMNDIRSQRQLQ